jgi:hypothetical protein
VKLIKGVLKMENTLEVLKERRNELEALILSTERTLIEFELELHTINEDIKGIENA